MDAIYIVTLVSMLLVLLATFSSLIAFRFGAPLLLLFLAIGLIAGVDGLGIAFDNGPAAYFVGSLALALILFDSGFGTSIHAFRQAAGPAVVAATIGVLITAGLVGAAAHYILGVTLMEGLLLGAIVASTDAAAVFFLLRVGGINIRDRVRSTLEVESGSNDPMAIFLTIVLVQIISSGGGFESLSVAVLLLFFKQMFLGVLFGMAGGLMIVGLVNRLRMERGLTPIFVLALSLLVFSLAGAVGGSGFLAVYVAGLSAGNGSIRSEGTIRRFLEGVSWLSQIIMFLLLGLLATPSQFASIALPAAGIAFFLIFVARPVAVWVSLLPFNYQRAETGFIAWVGLRGAVSILLAILPVLYRLDHGMLYFNTAFIVVLISLVVQGWTINPVARRLGLVVPPRIGPVDKVELELPGTAHHELLAYRVVADSPVARGVRLPRWARPSLVIREGKSMRYQFAGRLRAGDYVYLFISQRYPRLLDRLFASPAPVAEDDVEFFGAFAIDPTRPVTELQAAYGPELEPGEEDKTIAELMRDRLGGRAEYADRVAFGPVELIVRDVDEEGRIVSVGISLAPEQPKAQIPLFLNLRDMRDLLARAFGRKKAEAREQEAKAGHEEPEPAGADDEPSKADAEHPL
ncbi:MAG: K+/H+ antiporter [Rhizobiales bacterium 65-79]|nr:potassium/proton antiporter [Hyphomicrobiales bacterium]OJU03207.1 MAG: K+/H+ antiporter [Rhizobiales bacterium 65-79]